MLGQLVELSIRARYFMLVLLLALATVVARRIVQIWAQRRRGSAGAIVERASGAGPAGRRSRVGDVR